MQHCIAGLQRIRIGARQLLVSRARFNATVRLEERIGPHPQSVIANHGIVANRAGIEQRGRARKIFRVESYARVNDLREPARRRFGKLRFDTRDCVFRRQHIPSRHRAQGLTRL